MIQRLAPVALLFLAAACTPTPDPTAGSTLEVMQPVRMEFRVVVDADDPGATEFPHQESTLPLGPPQPFDVSRVFRSYDEYGLPAIGFQIADADSERFSEWTGSLAGSQIAVVINGAVVTAPTVNHPLAGGGIISGGSSGFTEDEVRAMIESMEPER